MGTLKATAIAAATCVALSGVVPAAADAPVTKDQVNKWMTELSNWGRWGKADQIGTLNLITADKRKAALKLARDGVAVSLAHTIDKEKAADNPRPLGQEMTLDTGGHAMDLYTIWYHGSIITHIDALCHYSFEGKIFNGFERSKIAHGPGCPDNGDREPEGRHHDARHHRRSAAHEERAVLEPGTPVYASDLEAWEKYAGIKIGSGDALFLRTGRWAQRTRERTVERRGQRGRLPRVGDAVARSSATWRCSATTASTTCSRQASRDRRGRSISSRSSRSACRSST